MKKHLHLLAALLTVVMLLTLNGCGKQPETSTVSESDFLEDNPYHKTNTSKSSAASETDSRPASEQSGAGTTTAKTDNQSGSTGTTKAYKATVTEETLPAVKAAYNIYYKENGAPKTIKTETGMVYDFHSEWMFNHGAYIAYFKGLYYAFWQRGYKYEDACGQHTAMATSKDGLHWSKATDLVGVKKGLFGSEMLSGPFSVYATENQLIVYINEFEYDPSELKGPDPTRPNNADKAKKVNRNFYYMSTTDGRTWTTGRKNSIVSGGGNRVPKVLPSGRLAWAGFNSLCCSDSLDGLTGWRSVGPSAAKTQDAYRRGGASMLLTESAVYTSTDGVVHLLSRSNLGWLWHSASYDNGETWSDLYATRFPDDNQKFDFLYLPDGRIMYIGTPISKNSRRMPLIAAVSKDGYTFDQQYMIGNTEYIAKNQYGFYMGNYSYPSAMIQGDYVYVIYAKQKEIIEVTRFKWTDLT